jgi:hypothetical protein
LRQEFWLAHCHLSRSTLAAPELASHTLQTLIGDSPFFAAHNQFLELMIEVEESCEFEGSVGRRSSSRGARRKKKEAYDEKTMKDNLYAFISGEGEATPLSKNMPRATSSNAKETKEMKEMKEMQEMKAKQEKAIREKTIERLDEKLHAFCVFVESRMRDYVCTLEDTKTKKFHMLHPSNELQFVLHPFTCPLYSQEEELVEPGKLSKMEQQFERTKQKQKKRKKIKMKAQGNVTVTEKAAKAEEPEAEEPEAEEPEAEEPEKKPRAKGKPVGQKGRRIIRRRASFYLAFKGVGLAKDEPLPAPLLQVNSQFWIDSVRSQYTFGNLSSTSIPEEAPKISTNVLPWRKLPDHVFSKEESPGQPGSGGGAVGETPGGASSHMYTRQQAVDFREAQQRRRQMELMQMQQQQMLHFQQQQQQQQQHLQRQHPHQSHRQHHQHHQHQHQQRQHRQQHHQQHPHHRHRNNHTRQNYNNDEITFSSTNRKGRDRRENNDGRNRNKKHGEGKGGKSHKDGNNRFKKSGVGRYHQKNGTATNTNNNAHNSKNNRNTNSTADSNNNNSGDYHKSKKNAKRHNAKRHHAKRKNETSFAKEDFPLPA